MEITSLSSLDELISGQAQNDHYGKGAQDALHLIGKRKIRILKPHCTRRSHEELP